MHIINDDVVVAGKESLMADMLLVSRVSLAKGVEAKREQVTRQNNTEECDAFAFRTESGAVNMNDAAGVKGTRQDTTSGISSR